MIINFSPPHARMLTGMILCWQPQLLWFHEVSGPIRSRRQCFSLVLTNRQILQSFHTSLQRWPFSLGEELWYKCVICAWALLTFILCTLTVTSFGNDQSHSAKKLWLGMTEALICTWRDANLKGCWLLCPLNKIMAVELSLRHVITPRTGSQPNLQYQVCASSSWVGLISNQKLLCYLNDVYVTFASMGVFCHISQDCNLQGSWLGKLSVGFL